MQVAKSKAESSRMTPTKHGWARIVQMLRCAPLGCCVHVKKIKGLYLDGCSDVHTDEATKNERRRGRYVGVVAAAPRAEGQQEAASSWLGAALVSLGA
jgi:hypothetical protein